MIIHVDPESNMTLASLACEPARGLQRGSSGCIGQQEIAKADSLPRMPNHAKHRHAARLKLQQSVKIGIAFVAIGADRRIAVEKSRMERPAFCMQSPSHAQVESVGFKATSKFEATFEDA